MTPDDGERAGRGRLRLALLAALLLLVLVPLAAWGVLARPRLPAAERGRRLAESLGCAACHGVDGEGGHPNPGRADGTVPNFRDDVMMYARDRAEIAEWIEDGVTARRADSESWQRERDAGTLRMPAFRGRLTPDKVDDLVAFVETMAGRGLPDDGPARAGHDRARELGCFGCHGPGGRLARPNRGSFKGYIPSWDGEDFAEVVRDRAEFDEWVQDGISKRFARNPFARHFLSRATVTMPAFRQHLGPGDLDLLWAWIEWLRSQPPPQATQRSEAAQRSRMRQ